MKTAIHSLSYCACLILFALVSGGCSDDATNSAGPRCGDGICSSSESPTNCNRDCSFECIPEATRCVGNTLVTCLDDGMHEDMDNCESGEVCAVDQCVDADSLPTPDVVESDAGDDSSTGDVSVDESGDAAADESTGDESTDVAEDTAEDTTEDTTGDTADTADTAEDTTADTAEDTTADSTEDTTTDSTEADTEVSDDATDDETTSADTVEDANDTETTDI